ncbi:MAG: efflux RND transporter permease subunit [Candidatus Omnitrophica bacterium]|nr:efflux RND transporter permease subunit [Candidatus Omnitrophota bacterium]
MNLPEFGVKRPVTNLMIFSAVLLLALYSFTRLGIDLFPEIEPPSISVIASYPGASPEDVEIKVTEALENQLGTTPGLEKITSFSTEGASVISLKFIWGTDLDAASNDVRDRIDLAKRFLPDIPDEMDNPFIFKFNTANIPIVFLGFTADQSYPELFDFVDKRIGDALRQLPGVGAVQIQGGGLERQINILVDSARLEGHGFSILDLQNVLARENVTQPVGNLKTGLTDYLIRLPGEFSSPDEINNVILGVRDKKIIYLRDVATVEDSFKEVSVLARINQKKGLIMMVQKQSGTNTVAVATRVKQRLEELQKTFPADVQTTIIFDTSKDIIDSLNNLKQSLWFAIAFVILVVWFFLRQISASLIVALTIPFSLLISFIYIFASGKTVNVISLSSLAIACGMVVDNAIVIVDNVYRRMERGQRPQEASIFGAQEMFLAVAASTLTTVVVFVPLLFVRGVVGIMFGELAMIVIVTLTASLFTATTFTPMLCSKWLRPHRTARTLTRRNALDTWYDFSEKVFSSWENFYAKALGWSLGHKKLVIVGFLALFVSSLFLFPFVGKEFIPEEDSGDVRMNVFLPIGTRLEEADKVSKKIEELLKQEVPEAEYVFVRCGSIGGVGRSFGGVSGSHIIAAGLKLVPKNERKRSVKEVGNIVRKRIQGLPGVMKTDITTGNPLGRLITGGSGKSIQLDIIGNSFEETDALANKMKAVLEKIPGTVDVSVSRELNRPELKIVVDRIKASSLGLSMDTITNTVRSYIQGSTASKYREKGETYDIVVRLQESGRTKIEDIENLALMPSVAVAAQAGGTSLVPVKLSTIATIEETKVPEEIERLNRERVVRVECNAFGRTTGQITDELQREIKKVTIPSGIMVNIGGEAEEQGEAFRDLFLLLILGICLVYMVMAAQFESLLDPFIVMFSVPFVLPGALLGFALTGTTLSILSFLGIVMLTGIVVNNAIVLVSYINILRARGLDIVAAVTAAGKDRLRPVLSTTITTLVGLLPLAISNSAGSETWRPLGVTMIGGLSMSTAVTMIFVPTLYAIFESRLKKTAKGVTSS